MYRKQNTQDEAVAVSLFLVTPVTLVFVVLLTVATSTTSTVPAHMISRWWHWMFGAVLGHL